MRTKRKQRNLIIFLVLILIALVCLSINVSHADDTKAKEQPKFKLISLGEYRITHYCGCAKCNGRWAGKPTASGVYPQPNRTIAVDTKVIPFGTWIVIDGYWFRAEDRGGAIKGNRIDIFCASHEEAIKKGVYKTKIFKVVWS